MRKFLIKTVLLFGFLIALPFVGLAADIENEGTVKIEIVNQHGQSISGQWYFHKGGENGLVVRNGISDEEFDVDEGNYYLEVRTTSDNKAFELDDDPLQFISTNEIYTYNVRYYADEEAKAVGPLSPLSEDDVNPVEEEEPEEEPVEEPVEEPAEEETPEGIEISPLPSPGPAPVGALEDTSSDETQVLSDSEQFQTLPQLAVTGLPVMSLILPSLAGGLLFTRRRRQ